MLRKEIPIIVNPNLLLLVFYVKPTKKTKDRGLKLEIPPSDLTGTAITNRRAIVNQEKYENSVREWDEAIKQNPENEVLWNNKGVSLVRLGRVKEAIKCYTKALKIKPDYEKILETVKDKVVFFDSSNIFSYHVCHAVYGFDELVDAYYNLHEVLSQAKECWFQGTKPTKQWERIWI